MIVKARKRK